MYLEQSFLLKGITTLNNGPGWTYFIDEFVLGAFKFPIYFFGEQYLSLDYCSPHHTSLLINEAISPSKK